MYYRSGLRLNNRTNTRSFFNALEEGVNEELTKRLISQYRKDPAFDSIVQITNKGVNTRDLDPEVKDDIIFLDENGNGRRFTYVKERAALTLLIEKIREKRFDENVSTEQVFDIFARAKFSGNLLPLSRLIDGSFGKGIFRKIGEAEKGDGLYEIVSKI